MDNSFTIEGVKKTIFGAGSICQIGEECKALRANRVLLVMHRHLLTGAGSA
jgi:alcohol dehydrogenase class IV